MRNLYNISKGQLTAIWVFGTIAELYFIGYSTYDSFYGMLTVVLPFLIVFYTLGWVRKQEKE